ncbi:hypothetical protein HZS_7431 [Henneguya salminicola]|nr:hypothetical protein HZS_7431 [Henneguya salminicola]
MVTFIKRSIIQKNLLVLKEFRLIISKVDGMLLNNPFHELVHNSKIIFKPHKSVCDGYFAEYIYLGEKICKIMKHFFKILLDRLLEFIMIML